MRNTIPAEPAPEVTRESLTAELTLQSQSGANVERPTAAMFGALLTSEHSAVQNLIDETAERARARKITRGAAVSLLRTTIIDYCRYRSEDEGTIFSDAGWLTPQDWKIPFADMADDLQSSGSNSKAVDAVYAGLYFRVAATPVKERYASIAAMAQLTRERFPAGARGLSIGCSIMAGELQLMHSAEFPITLRQVIGHDKQDITPQANKILSRTAPFKELVAVDTNMIFAEEHQQFDEGNFHFAVSGLRPSERNSNDYMHTLLSLKDKKDIRTPGYTSDSGVTFHRGNLLEAAELDDFTSKFSEPFDVIMMNFLTQELSPAEQIRLHEVALRLVSDNGLIIYNHQAYIPPVLQGRPTDISGVHHFGSYATTRFTSATHCVDMAHPVRGVQEVMRFHNNRCQVARINKAARLMVNGNLVPIADLIVRG